MLIDDLLPADVYAQLLETVPPPEGFEVADKVKANFDPAKGEAAPEQSRTTWMWFQNEIVSEVLTPLLLDRFRPSLASAYEALFGAALAEEALQLRHTTFRGRLMLRRPGYQLRPHRDMKNAALTGLVYFAKPGDSPEYGTDLFRIENDREAPFMKTFYPESAGGRAELVRSVPFVGNSALVFLNVPGMAHGAGIPREAPQAVRLAYQFYIGARKADLATIVRRLPPERQATWVRGVADADY